MKLIKMKTVACRLILAAGGFASFRAAAATTYTYTVDHVKWSYTIANDVATITSAVHADDTDISGDLVFPGKVKDDAAGEDATEYTVTKIGGEAFKAKTLITSIRLPESIVEIGSLTSSSAFIDCTGLTNAIMPGVTMIGRRTFGGCSALVHVEMPKVQKIGEMGFASCNKLSNVFMPEIQLLNGKEVFSGTAIPSIALPYVENLPPSVFNGCTKLWKIDIPLVKTIESKALNDCTSLSNIVMPRVTQLGDGSIRQCSGLENINMPRMEKFNGMDSKQGIIHSASKLVSFKFPYTMTTNCYCSYNGRDYSPFSCDKGNCSNLEVIGIHRSSPLWMEMTASEAFYDAMTNALLKSYSSDKVFSATATIVPYGGSVVGENGIVWIYDDLNMPEGTIRLAAATNVASEVEIPDALTIDGVEKRITEVEVSAFIDNPALAKVRLGKYVTHVGAYAFDGCAEDLKIKVHEKSTDLIAELKDEYGDDAVEGYSSGGLLIIIK